MNTEPPERTPVRRLPNPLQLGLLSAAILVPAKVLADSRLMPEEVALDTPSYAGQTALWIGVAIILNSLFVAGDTAIELLRSSHVRASEKDPKAGKNLRELLDRRLEYIAACALGSQIMRALMVLLCLVPAPWLAHQWANSRGQEPNWSLVVYATLVIMIPVFLVNMIIGELVPRSVASLHPQAVATRTFWFVRAFGFVFSIPNRALIAMANLISNRFGAQASFALPRQAEDEIRLLVESTEETGEFEEVERELITSVLEFGDTVAREVMTPRVDLDSAPVGSNAHDIISLIEASGHSRIPLYEETDDQIVGIVHAKDLLESHNHGERFSLRGIMRPVYFVPESKNLLDLLREMRHHRTQMVVVQDEFGATAGVVTIEDIVEELVGDIVDEYDQDESEITSTPRGWVVDGRVNLYDLNQEIGSNLESEEFETIGGYVFGLFGRQPKEGEMIESDGYRFTVEQSDGRRIASLLIVALQPFEGSLSDMLV